MNSFTPAATDNPLLLPCAYHITDAFTESDLEKLNGLREKIPLDVSRPTCPRRFLTEKQLDPVHDDTATTAKNTPLNRQHQEDGWVGALLDKTVASRWNLPFCSLPWYRFLEYTEPGGHMDKHTDGSNLHPATGSRSVATMLIYLSTCRQGGETTLYRGKSTKQKGKQFKQQQTGKRPNNLKGNQQPKQQQQKNQQYDAVDLVIERIRPIRNTVLIFPHSWPHSGDPVVADDPKIALRVDLTWKQHPVEPNDEE